MVKVFIGTAGFSYSHWLGDFYPPDIKKEAMLSFYAKHFSTVEINSSFYHIPRQQTVLNWKKQTPADFIFSFKMSRFVSHFAKLDAGAKSFPLFFQAIKPLESSPAKHLVLIQTPASFKINVKKLKNFLKHLPQGFLYAFEFRHWSWFCEEVYEILKKFNAAVVLSDSPRKAKISVLSFLRSRLRRNVGGKGCSSKARNTVSSLPETERYWPYVNIDTASFFYLRFHGSRRLFSSSYTDEELKFYAQLIKEKLKKGMAVYAYFNNDAEGQAVLDGKRLRNLLLDI